jgi:hypothetical protein
MLICQKYYLLVFSSKRRRKPHCLFRRYINTIAEKQTAFYWVAILFSCKAETKAYKSSITHYYQSWEKDNYEWSAQSQSVTGYYPSYSLIDNVSESDLLLGVQMNDIVLTFKPDYNNNTIYGIGKYEIDYVEGTQVYKSWNPLYWNY